MMRKRVFDLYLARQLSIKLLEGNVVMIYFN